MKPKKDWTRDWRIGVNPAREGEVAAELVDYFADFWATENLDEKSKTTRNRYSGSLHALGGYLVEKAIFDENSTVSASELIFEYTSEYEGPLIYQDNETWQKEFDVACKKLHRYMRSR